MSKKPKKIRRESGRVHIDGDLEQGIPDEVRWDDWNDHRDGWRDGRYRDATQLAISNDTELARQREKQRRLERRRRLR